MIMHKGVSQEVQLINIWEINALSSVLENVKVILFLGIDVFSIRHRIPFSSNPPPPITKERYHVMVHGSRICGYTSKRSSVLIVIGILFCDIERAYVQLAWVFDTHDHVVYINI